MARRKQGSFYPSVPAKGAKFGVYNERVQELRADTLPPGDVGVRNVMPETRAGQRLWVEALLDKREAISPDDWRALGADVEATLRSILDDGSLRPVLRQRVMIALGQIAGDAATARLGEILTDPREAPIDRAYAATALGTARSGQAIAALGRAVLDGDQMVRRQVAHALAKIGTPETVPFLRALAVDAAPGVAEYAVTALSQRKRKATRPSGRRSSRKLRPRDD